ncbi:MAG: prolipoprotein diacylglyceryl transferase [Bacteroidetes bacterium]|nr:prolipoprotein diacylglyceryl transferase [Bacteroidota bacterium]
MEKLKRRWNVDSAGKVCIILCVFALTGTTVMFLRRFLKSEFDWAQERWFTYSYYWLILPFYNVLLLMYGAIFGQFRFFCEFEKRFFRRLFSIFKRRS